MNQKIASAIALTLLTACSHVTGPLSSSQSQRGFADVLREEQLRTVGIQPGTEKAHVATRIVVQEESDPDIQAMFVQMRARKIDPQNPNVRKAVLAEGLLRLSASDRDVFIQRAAFMAENEVPPDCDGMDPTQSFPRHFSFAHATVELVRASMDMEYRAMKAAATSTDNPVNVSPSQHSAATAATGEQLIRDLNGDEAAQRKFAAFVVDPSHVSPTVKCFAAKASVAAISHLPQPLRDYAAIESLERLRLANVAALLPLARAQVNPALPVPSPSESSPSGGTIERRHAAAKQA
ncbi:hypothetical protein [Caballeronia sp. ATUFL_M1_KS5A]|uniref:hypothetical protein n=1 Tax=Caballeronia sp. ATUFL_M1_KS5A TaxID=2921778 RepID=UPI0020298EC2|nr:hypothetical protein [Caballeronia sp. ATUFL_M1_KS5A]